MVLVAFASLPTPLRSEVSVHMRFKINSFLPLTDRGLACFRLDISGLDLLFYILVYLFLFRSVFSANHTGGHSQVIFPPLPLLRCCFAAS